MKQVVKRQLQNDNRISENAFLKFLDERRGVRGWRSVCVWGGGEVALKSWCVPILHPGKCSSWEWEFWRSAFRRPTAQVQKCFDRTFVNCFIGGRHWSLRVKCFYIHCVWVTNVDLQPMDENMMDTLSSARTVMCYRIGPFPGTDASWLAKFNNIFFKGKMYLRQSISIIFRYGSITKE